MPASRPASLALARPPRTVPALSPAVDETRRIRRAPFVVSMNLR